MTLREVLLLMGPKGAMGTKPSGIKRKLTTHALAPAPLNLPAPPSAATLPAGRGRRGAQAGGAGGSGRGRARPLAGAAGSATDLQVTADQVSACLPAAPWAIATRWGPTRHWWSQVRRR